MAIVDDKEEAQYLREQIEHLKRKVELGTEDETTWERAVRDLVRTEERRRRRRKYAITVAELVSQLQQLDQDLPVARHAGPLDWIEDVKQDEDDLGPLVVID